MSLSGLMPPLPSQYRIHMAWVPGGNVIANVRGVLDFCAIVLKSAALLTVPLDLLCSVIACPLRFKSQGMTIGFFGLPASPIVEASGIPMSMCVPCISPVERLSRIAAQLAPFTIVERMPYFLKNPFSWAITNGEQSVSA